jgi:restriction system protein
MAVPSYQEIMLPVLQILNEKGMLHARTLAMLVADKLGITQAEKEAVLPSGKQLYIVNRTGWAAWYMQHAGLTSRPKRGHFDITAEGKKLLSTKPSHVDNKLLATYPSFVDRVLKPKVATSGDEEPVLDVQETKSTEATKTPHERVESAFLELRSALTTQLLDQLATVDPFRFEQIVLDLLVAMGYGGSRKEAAEVTQKTNDEGIDGVINEDRLGLDVIYVQAKRWKSTVGRPEIQSFVGALAGKKASKGIFITTSDFNSFATEYAAGLHQKVILISGRRLAGLMIDNNIGVAEEHVYRLKRLDGDYFESAEL